MGEQSLDDGELAARYGAHASFRTDSAPAKAVYDSGNPADDLAQLLHHHARAESCLLDIGCGAGQTLCRLAPLVQEAWGFDQDRELVAAFRRRISQLELRNVTCVEGNVAEDADVAQLPDDHFDLAVSQRGPNINASLLRTLRPNALFIQEFVGEFDSYPLNEALGRRVAKPYSATGHESLMRQYMNLGLFPVGTREYFYEEYFRNDEHLAAYLGELGPVRWPQPTDANQDRQILTAYASEHMTPSGVRLVLHRRLFVMRRMRPGSDPRIDA